MFFEQPVGPLLFALGLHGAISEGRAYAEAINCPADVAAFYLDDGLKAFLEGLQGGLGDRGHRSASTSSPGPFLPLHIRSRPG